MFINIFNRQFRIDYIYRITIKKEISGKIRLYEKKERQNYIFSVNKCSK